MIGFKIHFQLHPRPFDALENSVEIFLFDGGYAGLEPIETGLANFCMVAHKTLYNACGNNWQLLLETLFHALPPLARRLEQSEACRDRPLSIFGIPYGYIYQGDGPPGLYRIGDQMAVIPSFCGNGIAIALHTARLASAHAMGLNSQADYYRQARAEIGPQVRSATKLMQWGSNPWMQKTFHAACRVYPDLLTMAAAQMARRRPVRPAA